MDALDVLLQNLTDDEQMLSIARLYVLSGLEPTDLERVRVAWPLISAERRQAVVRHLADISEANFEVDFGLVFRLGLTDDDPDVRAAAIDGLWEEDDVKLIPTLIDLVQNDAVETVRATAAGSLGRFVLAGELEEIPVAKLEQVVEVLREIIADASETLEVRRRAVEAIGYSSAEGVSEIIADAYDDPDELMRVSAVFAMGRSADVQWAEVALRETESPNPEMRFEAARASGELQNRDAVPVLARLLEDPDDQVREAAVWALGQIGGNESRRLLTAILEDEDSDLHEPAEVALEELEFITGDNLDLTLFELYEDDDDDNDDADPDA
ncbi:MAG TPA: HEAT repeat domain-containing protein [Anaerolineae bacterium]|nr:HEAT repeat domain-containing protein [Anaerolineae bacterium]